MSDKIKPHHLARKALLYVRQSSTHQVLHNRESQALQYAMRDRLAPTPEFEWQQLPEETRQMVTGLMVLRARQTE
jgi:hypothetical protein